MKKASPSDLRGWLVSLPKGFQSSVCQGTGLAAINVGIQIRCQNSIAINVAFQDAVLCGPGGDILHVLRNGIIKLCKDGCIRHSGGACRIIQRLQHIAAGGGLISGFQAIGLSPGDTAVVVLDVHGAGDTTRHVGDLVQRHAAILSDDDPEIMAAQLSLPISVWINLCDREPDRELEVMELAGRHIQQFFRAYQPEVR